MLAADLVQSRVVVYRGRLAPSPTGLLHLGHARTFWTASVRARAHNGTLILRNEDLDPHRACLEFVAAMLADLRWLGLDWQEGPDVGGLGATSATSSSGGATTCPLINSRALWTTTRCAALKSCAAQTS
jgi:glutamyl/glutaminyl-tRNA synthetase